MVGSRAPAGTPIAITIGTSDSQVANYAPGAVKIGPGQLAAEFDVSSTAHPDTIPATISSSYGGLQKTVALTFTPAAIRLFSCEGNRGRSGTGCGHIVGGQASPQQASVQVRLTAPAPSGGYAIPISSNSQVLGVSGNFVVPAGQELSSPFTFQEHAVAVETSVSIAARDPISGEKKTIIFDVQPPRPQYIHFYGGQGTASVSNVPLDGREVPVILILFGVSPSNGMKFDIQYQWKDSAGETLSPTDIKGPRTVTVAGGNYDSQFNFIAPPCGINPPCKISIVIGSASGTVIVNP